MTKKIPPQNRIPELDIAKGIAIMGVMLVHFPSEYRFVHYGIAFHIVTFFAVTGILLEKNQKPFGSAVKDKFCTVLLPYFMLSGIYIIVFFIQRLIVTGEMPVAFVKYVLKITLLGIGAGTLWFLPVLFLGVVICLAAKQIFREKAVPVLLAMAVLCTFGAQLFTSRGYFGSVQAFTPKGIIKNEMQLVCKGFIAAGYITVGPYIWRVINRLENMLKTRLYIAVGGVSRRYTYSSIGFISEMTCTMPGSAAPGDSCRVQFAVFT